MMRNTLWLRYPYPGIWDYVISFIKSIRSELSTMPGAISMIRHYLEHLFANLIQSGLAFRTIVSGLRAVKNLLVEEFFKQVGNL